MVSLNRREEVDVPLELHLGSADLPLISLELHLGSADLH